MINLLKKKHVTSAKPAFIEVRSYHGMAFHILDTEDPSSTALCGYEHWVHTNTSAEVTKEKLLETIPNQHSSWFWCAECRDILLRK